MELDVFNYIPIILFYCIISFPIVMFLRKEGLPNLQNVLDIFKGDVTIGTCLIFIVGVIAFVLFIPALVFIQVFTFVINIRIKRKRVKL